MGRLKNVGPLLPMLKPKLGYATGDQTGYTHYRIATQSTLAWYKTYKWQQLRWSVLTRDCFTCAMCQRTEADTSRLVCDHVTPHRGDARAFWAGPFQTLCKPCHDRLKQAEEAKHL